MPPDPQDPNVRGDAATTNRRRTDDAQTTRTPMTPAPDVTLNNGVAMPALGLGTWPLDDAEAERTIAHALRTGYRLVDTAENYRNERGVGRLSLIHI